MFTFTPSPSWTKRNTHLTEQMGQKEGADEAKEEEGIASLFPLC